MYITCISPGPRLSFWTAGALICYYGEELLTTRPTPKMEDHTLSSVREYLFNIFADTLHIEGRSFIRNLRTRHAIDFLRAVSDGVSVKYRQTYFNSYTQI
jgi:hypothetical protein